MCAIARPSGENDGAAHIPLLCVSRLGSPPAASTTNTSDQLSYSRSACRAETNASCLPSGDHEAWLSSQSPSVICLGSALPSTGTTNRCLRWSYVKPSPLTRYFMEVMQRNGLAFFVSGSGASPVLAENTICPPSGDHIGAPAPSGSLVRRRDSPPPAGMIASCGFSSPRSLKNASDVPSGAQRGAVSRFAPAVNWRGSPPAVSTTQIADL